MNIQDIDFAADTMSNIIELVTQLYEFYKSGGTKEQLNQIWNKIASNTEIAVKNFDKAVEEAK